MLFKGLNNMSHQLVSDNILSVKLHHGNSLDFPQHLDSRHQAGITLVREIDLGNVARDDKFGIAPHAREEHLI